MSFSQIPLTVGTNFGWLKRHLLSTLESEPCSLGTPDGDAYYRPKPNLSIPALPMVGAEVITRA